MTRIRRVNIVKMPKLLIVSRTQILGALLLSGISITGAIVYGEYRAAQALEALRKQPTVGELLATACPVSHNEPVAIVVSANNPRELLKHVDGITQQLRKFEELGYVKTYQ